MRTENDILKRFLRIFVRHPDFMVCGYPSSACTADYLTMSAIQIRLRHVICAALLAPNIPAYVEGTSAQVQVSR